MTAAEPSPSPAVPRSAHGVSVRFGRTEVELRLGSEYLQLPSFRYASAVRTREGRRRLLTQLAGDEVDDTVDEVVDGAGDTLELAPGHISASDSGDSSSWDAVPLVLGSAWLVRPVGRGSFGEVYEALDLDDGRSIAVKLLKIADAGAISRFKAEFRNLARIGHPNLISPDEQGHREGGWWWYSMELVQGVSFIDFVRPGSWGPAGPAVRYGRLLDALRQLVEALDTLHRNDLLHLDLKSANVLVRPDRQVAVLDFGLSEPLHYNADGSRTASEGFRGTPGYIAPEILERQQPGTAADWYSLGALLFRVLTNQQPRATGVENRFDLLSDDVPEQLCSLVEALLRRDPALRPDANAIRRVIGLVRAPQDVAADLKVGFVGREDAMTVLEDSLSRVRLGRPVCVQVSGAPGIGKTALIDEFLDRAINRPRPPLILRGRCYERQSIPYNGFDQVMDGFGRSLSGMDLFEAAEVLGSEVNELQWIFPAVGQKRRRDDPTASGEGLAAEQRQRAFQAVKTVLRRASRDRPIIVVLDDVQWGDVDTVELLNELVSPPQPCTLLLVLAVRHPEGQGSAFLTRWEAVTAMQNALPIERLPLEPLARSESAAWIRAVLGEGATPPKIDALARSSGGVPYWLDALLGEARRDENFLPEGPSSVHELVGQRVDGLDRQARLVIDLVAFVGRPIDPHTLLAAMESDASKRSIHQLRRLSLIRETGLPPMDLLEAYHDRVREAVVARAEPERARRIHAALAHALEAAGAPPEELGEHHFGAGDRQRGAEFAILGAEEATRHLAFERAAELLQRAQEWGDLTGEKRRHVQGLRARALHNAGHCTAAAEQFSEAAQGATPQEARALATRAADAWLSAGQVDQGLAALVPAFDHLGLHRPRSALRTALAVLRDLGRLLLRGPVSRAGATATPEENERIDLCWSVGKGLVPVLPLEGTAFMLQSLHRALSAGDPHRSARVLAFVAVFLFQLPGLRRVGQRYLAHARAVGDSSRDAYLQAATELWTAATHVFTGNWQAMADAAERAGTLFDTRCVGVSWERVMATGFAVWSLQFKGEMTACGEASEAALRDAQRRGDLYGQVLFRPYLSLARLAAGDVVGARHHADRVATDWMKTPYTVPRFYAMWLQATCDLYVDDVDAAESRVQADLDDFRQAGGRRLPMWRVDMALLEARIGLASLRRGRESNVISPLKQVVKLLDKESRADGPAHGRMIRAAIAAQGGDAQRAGRLLSEAIELYRSAGMRLFEHSARLRRADLMGDDASARELSGWMVDRGVVDPEGWARMYTPVLLPPRSGRLDPIRRRA